MNTNTLKKQSGYLVPEMVLALLKDDGEPVPLASLDDISRFVEPLRHAKKEHFVVFHIDAADRVTGYQDVSPARHDSTLVRFAEVFKTADIANSSALIIATNKLSGSSTPSSQDILAALSLVEEGNLRNIEVADYVIVSANGLCSMRQHLDHLWNR